MNFRRAGVLKKRSRTSTVVPRGRATAPDLADARPPSTSTRVPAPSSAGRGVEPEAGHRRDGRAAPRRGSPSSRWRRAPPRRAASRWRGARARGPRRPRSIPQPSSATRTSASPPSSTSTATARAPASSAFSTSSFTTEAGRSTTSPAAIWFTSPGGRTWMRGIGGLRSTGVRLDAAPRPRFARLTAPRGPRL